MTTILHVEDDLDMSNIVKILLKKKGFKIISAPSGKEALEKIKNMKLDLILLDVMLPDMSGWDIYDEIRKKDKNVKVAFLTIVDLPRERVEELIKKKGVADFIKKPFENKDLVKRVKKIL